MGFKIRALFGGLLGSDAQLYERLKIIFLGLIFFCVVGGYTIAKELGGSIFIATVGEEYVPWADILAMLILIPALFLYAKLVDKVRRYQLLAGYSLFFGILGLIFAYFIGHTQIGISNTDLSPYRFFGWLFYVFVAGYSPFVVSVFWAFANSVSSPDEAKKNYAYIVSGSKLGGMISSGLAWFLFSSNNSLEGGIFTDAAIHQIVLAVSSLMLIIIPGMVFLFMKYVPGHYLHGYEAVYQVEKQKKKKGKTETGIFAGLVLLLRYPYVLGIFSMVYFYEFIAKVLSYLRLSVAHSYAESVAGVSGYLFKTIFFTHALGFLISVFATRLLLRSLGVRICLLLIPLSIGATLLCFMVNSTPFTLMIAFGVLRAINYAFGWPVRENLYIPTVKEIKFKSKSWIDAFGSKFAKANGSAFKIFVSRVGEPFILSTYSFFFAGVISLWFLAAFLLGKRFDRIVRKNEVIGADEEDEEIDTAEISA